MVVFNPRICWPCVGIIRTVALLPLGNTICFWEQLFVFIEKITLSEFYTFLLDSGFSFSICYWWTYPYLEELFWIFAGSYLRQSNIFTASYIYFNELFRLYFKKRICEPKYKGKGSLPFFPYSYVSSMSQNLGQAWEVKMGWESILMEKISILASN